MAASSTIPWLIAVAAVGFAGWQMSKGGGDTKQGLREPDEDADDVDEPDVHPTDPTDPVEDMVIDALRSKDPVEQILVAREIQLRHADHPRADEWVEELLVAAYNGALTSPDNEIKQTVAQALNEFDPNVGDEWDLMAVEILESQVFAPMSPSLRAAYEGALQSSDLAVIDAVLEDLADGNHWSEYSALWERREQLDPSPPQTVWTPMAA